MPSETRKKEIRQLRNPELKMLLMQTEDQLFENSEIAYKQKNSDNREIKTLEEKNQSLQNQLGVQVDHLDNVRKAIESIAALRFPGTEFDTSSWIKITPPAGYVKMDEPEELLALRHLYSLTGF